MKTSREKTALALFLCVTVGAGYAAYNLYRHNRLAIAERERVVERHNALLRAERTLNEDLESMPPSASVNDLNRPFIEYKEARYRAGLVCRQSSIDG